MATDSKKKYLTMPEVIHAALSELDLGDTPPGAVLLSIAQEMSSPNCDVVQFGNTVFISHMAKDNSLAVMRALNADSARNVVQNGAAYMKYLAKKGVYRYVTDVVSDSPYHGLFNMLKRKGAAKKIGITGIAKKQFSSGIVRYYVQLDRG